MDPQPSVCGGQSGDIYLCRFSNPLLRHKPSDRILISHEAAHIFAAQPHFGDGLMSAGGDDDEWFTHDEIQVMHKRINQFRYSIRYECFNYLLDK